MFLQMFDSNFHLLAISLLALAVGPVLHQLARIRGTMLAALDGFVYVTMGGVVFLHIVPESYELAGWWSILALLAGLLGPGLIEHRLRGLARQAHAVALLLALMGIGLHGFMDGLALGHAGGDHDHHMLPMAILLHRLPVGLAVWFLLRPAYGLPKALGLLALIGGATLAGFALGEAAVGGLANQGLGLFQALVAGSLLHVVVHRSYPIEESASTPQTARRHAGIGALVGLFFLWALTADLFGVEGQAAARMFVDLALESAPALLLAYVGAGLVHALMPKASLQWLRRGNSFSQSLRGIGFGLPLPICSCGVVPIYRTLVAQGVPASAAMSFLVATPELSLDAVLISLPLLGGTFTVVRIVCAAVVALAVGWGIGRLVAPALAGKLGKEERDEQRSLAERIVAGLRTGFGEVVDDTAPWIVLGMGAAALIAPFLSAEWLAKIPSSVEVVFFALLGIPTYVCASGATPLVAVLIFKGVSPGAALAFLLTGPATNLTTFGVLARLHGPRVAAGFGAGIMAMAVALGYGVNGVLDLPPPPVVGAGEGHGAWSEAALAGLGILFAFSLLRRGPRGFVGEIFAGDEDEDHEHNHGHDDEHDRGHVHEQDQDHEHGHSSNENDGSSSEVHA